MALCDQPKAFASDLGDDQSHYLLDKWQQAINPVETCFLLQKAIAADITVLT